MTPYLIFVIAITIAYIIYYGYNISKDIYGKKNQEDSTEETFDIDFANDQPAPVEVRETGDGFSFGDTMVSPAILEENPEKESDEPSEDEKKIANLKESLDEADVDMTGAVDEFELSELLAKKNSNVEFRKKQIIENRANV